jgi:protein-disulfide isomerase
MASSSLDANALQAIGKQFQFTPGSTAEANRGLGEVRLLSEKLHIEGTPALVIGDTLVRGALDLTQLESRIRAARQSRQAAEKTRSPPLKLAANALDPAR